MNWHLELLLHVDSYPNLYETFADFPVDISVGHMGYMKTIEGIDNPGFQDLLKLMRDGGCWVKTSGAYRITVSERTPYPDVIPLAHALIDANPDRVLWGSDWPHPIHYGFMPNDGYLLDQMLDWTNDDAIRQKILVDNPATLYGF